MNSMKKIMVCATLILASSSTVHAAGEVTNVLLGIVTGIGYEKAVRNLDAKYSAPLVLVGLISELFLSAYITHKAFKADRAINLQPERARTRDRLEDAAMKRNWIVAYGMSTLTGVAIYCVDEFNKDEPKKGKRS